jgi:hypothetical protein
MQFRNGLFNGIQFSLDQMHDGEVDLVSAFFELLYLLDKGKEVRIKYFGSLPKFGSLK